MPPPSENLSAILALCQQSLTHQKEHSTDRTEQSPGSDTQGAQRSRTTPIIRLELLELGHGRKP